MLLRSRTLTVLAMTVIACAPAPAPADARSVQPASAAVPAAAPREDLARLAGRSVLFGHQSVGENILDGVGRLVSSAGVGPRVARLDAMVAPSPGVLGHVLLPENGDPARKMRAFAEAIDRLGDRAPDIALMKLCFVDFDAPGTDVARLFELYRKTLADLEARHPRTTFVHVTVPLTQPQGGAKAMVKRLFGKAPWGVVENVRREEFNARLRVAYGDRVFDLARLESTGPAGERATVEWQGRAVPAMFPAYTDDGGHLNARGQDAVARAFVAQLAGVPGR
jgi:hypothetical protein